MPSAHVQPALTSSSSRKTRIMAGAAIRAAISRGMSGASAATIHSRRLTDSSMAARSILCGGESMEREQEQRPSGGITPHITIRDRRAAEAIDWYKKAFGAEE